MSAVTLSQGDIEEVYQGEPGDRLYVRTDGIVRVHTNRRWVRNGRVLPADGGGEITLHERGEEIYVFAEEAATVEVIPHEMSVRLFGREVFGLDVNRGSVASDSNNRLSQDQARRSAEAVEEVNADQTQTVSASGGSQTSTITAASGEVWTLQAVHLQADATSGTGSGQHSFKVATEKEGVGVGFGESDFASEIRYDDGEWISAPTKARDDLTGTQIDDTNGLDVTYTNGTEDNQTATRTIRLQFSAVTA